VLFGAVSFMLFALVSFLTLAGYYFGQHRRWGTPDPGANEKVERLRRKIEALDLRSSPPSSSRYATGPLETSREKELERGIEELRTIVIALSKVVENPGRH
jgi:hypothetical protein